MPNLAVDVSSRARSACYPRRNFYPVSDVHTNLRRRITKTEFPPCLSCHSHSQAPLCLYTLCTVPGVLREPLCASVTFWEATAPVKLPTRPCPEPGFTDPVRLQTCKGWSSIGGSTTPDGIASQPPTYYSASQAGNQGQAIVKLHGVFSSCCQYCASSRRLQFRRVAS